MDAETLDIPDSQVLVHYPSDADNLVWHHRILLKKVSTGVWITLTPDHELKRHDLTRIHHAVCERRATFPEDEVDINEVYAHDPIPASLLASFKRRAAVQVSILGDVEKAEDVQRFVWVVAERGHKAFGEIVENATLDDASRAATLDSKGVTMYNGVETYIEKIAANELDDWKKQNDESSADVRLLGDHKDAAGRRTLTLSEALSLMRKTDAKDFPLPGVRCVFELLQSVAEVPGNLISYHAEWIRRAGVSEGSSVAHVHRNGRVVLRLTHSWDQLNASSLASAEQMARWIVQTEVATEWNPRHPDFSGLDIIIWPHHSRCFLVFLLFVFPVTQYINIVRLMIVLKDS